MATSNAPSAKARPARYRLPLFAALSALLLLLAACVEVDDDGEGDNGVDDQPVIGAPDTDDQDRDQDEDVDDNDVPPLYEVSEATSDDGEHHAALIAYGQQPPVQMDALLEGDLALNGTCLGVEGAGGEDHFVPVVWPEGFTVGFDNGNATLIDDSGEVLAAEGEPVSLGGGNSPDPDGNVAEIAPEDCVADSYWMSGSEVRRLAPEVDPEPAIDNDMTVYFPQWENEDPSEAGSFAGRLTLDNECLVIDHETGSTQRLAIWPPEWTIEADGEDVVVLDESGNERARTGDILSVESQLGQFDVDEHGIPAGCDNMHALVFDVEVTGGPDDEMPEPHVMDEDEALERQAEQYANDHDVEFDEALRRLDLQGQLYLYDEHLSLEKDEVDHFAGLFWEHEPEFRLVVNMTNGDEEAVRKHFDNPDLLDVLEVRTVDYSLRELRDIQRELTDQLKNAGGVDVDSGTMLRTNEVLIYTTDKAAVEETLDLLDAANIIIPDNVVIVEEEAEAETLDDPTLDD